MSRQGLDLRDSTIVCVITGSGLKDPETAMAIPTAVREVPADLAAVEKAIGVA